MNYKELRKQEPTNQGATGTLGVMCGLPRYILDYIRCVCVCVCVCVYIYIYVYIYMYIYIFIYIYIHIYVVPPPPPQ